VLADALTGLLEIGLGLVVGTEDLPVEIRV
jgi:hypothetical protein